MNLYLRPNTGKQLACVEIEGRSAEDLSWTGFQAGVDYCVRSGKDLNSDVDKSFLLVRVDSSEPALADQIVVRRESLTGWGPGHGTFVPLELTVRRENLWSKDWVLVVDFGNSRTSVVAICNPAEDARPFQLLSLVDVDMPRLNYTGEGELDGDYLTRSFILFDRVERREKLVDGESSFETDFKCYIGEAARQLSVDYVVPSSSLCYSPKRSLWDRDEPLEPRYLTSVGKEPVPDPISGGHLRNCHVAAYFLRELLRASNESLNRISGGDENVINTVRRIVFSVPAAFSMAEREELQRSAQWAAQNAGLGDHLASNDATFVISDEANAAATYFLKTTYEAATNELGVTSSAPENGDSGALSDSIAGQKFTRLLEKYGRPGMKSKTLTVMLVDIGAGTTDVAVNRYRWIKGKLAIGRRVIQIDSFLLGGDNISEELIRLLADRVAKEVEMPREVLACNFETTLNAREQVRRLLFERLNGYAEQIKQISAGSKGRLSREWIEMRFDDIVLGTTFPHHVDPFDYLHYGSTFHHGLFYAKDSQKPKRVILEAQTIEEMVQQVLNRFPRELQHLRMLADRLTPDVVILAGMSSRLPGVREVFEAEVSGSSHRVIQLSNLHPHDNPGMQHIATTDVIQCGFDKLAVVLGAAILAAGKYYDERPRIINDPNLLAFGKGTAPSMPSTPVEEDDESDKIRGFYPQPRFIAIPAGRFGLEFDPKFGFDPKEGFDSEGNGDFSLPWNSGSMLSISSSFCDPRKFCNHPATTIANITTTKGEFGGVVKLRVKTARPSEVQIIAVGRNKHSLRPPEEGEFVVKHQRPNDVHFSNHGVLITPQRQKTR